jgi:rare lipoprotein A
LGRKYVPYQSLTPYRARGIASWYGRKFHGKPTSSGERYDMYAMTAAHTILPIPSYARVTNLSNGRSVVVRVNDRGPFHSERIIDLSYAAAYKLGYVNAGSASVEVEAILPRGSAAAREPRALRPV